MTITTIIFDLGNVVLTNDWHQDCPEKFQEYSDYFGITYDDMEKGWNAFCHEFGTGKITENEFWKGFLETVGTNKIDIEHAKKIWRKYQKPIENILDLLSKLKKHYNLIALTNIGKGWLDYKREKYNLDSYFEVIVSSCHSGFLKPDPKIYELLLKRINVKPEECLFIDDTQKVLPPAEKLGIKTLLFLGQSDLEKHFKELGIKF